MNNEHIWTVIMAGGLGSRFWPVSSVDCPKQFVDTMGVGRSMLQLTFERMEKICPRDHIVVVTGEQYADRVREQVPNLLPWQVLGEPLRRNTAPCIAYAAAVIAQMDPDATIVVSPADHAIFGLDRFVRNLTQAIECVQEHDWIITLGAQPVKPDTSYGYIQFSKAVSDCENLYEVVTFTEKPPVSMARQMIASGEFFWNTGMLVWRLPVLQQAYRQFLPAIADTFFNLTLNTSHATLEQVYSQCEAISVDHGIMEKADNVHVMAASFGWSDVETWESLYDVFRHDRAGNAIVNGLAVTNDTRNCVVVVPADKTVVLDGLDGYIVAADEDTILICRRKNEDKIFKFASDAEMQQLLYSKVK
jgi:mannose-1-phosphate guanylyltransferase